MFNFQEADDLFCTSPSYRNDIDDVESQGKFKKNSVCSVVPIICIIDRWLYKNVIIIAFDH